MSVTLKDIAKRANVNPGTVSRTLRNVPEAQRLRPETRERIMRIAKEMGYQRNLLAASTRTGIVNIIGVIGTFPHQEMDFSYANMLDGLITECAANGYTVKFYADSQLQHTFDEIAGTLIKNLICLTPAQSIREQVACFCRQNHLNLIFIYERTHQGFPCLNVDNLLAAKMAVRHLTGLGHRRIGLLCVPHNRYHYIDERHQGFLEGLMEAGIPPDPQLIDCTGDAARATGRMLELPKDRRPTALFGIADNLVALAQQVALDRGLTLPRDLSTCGMGDALFCPLLACPLTSLHEYALYCGNFAVRLLLGKQCPLLPDDQGNYRIAPQLVQRQSTAPCPNHD